MLSHFPRTYSKCEAGPDLAPGDLSYPAGCIGTLRLVHSALGSSAGMAWIPSHPSLGLSGPQLAEH